jgi:Flp pilus assembly protein TadB
MTLSGPTVLLLGGIVAFAVLLIAAALLVNTSLFDRPEKRSVRRTRTRTWHQVLIDAAAKAMTSRTRQHWYDTIEETLQDFPEDQHAALLRNFLFSALSWITTSWYLRARHPFAGATADRTTNVERK